MRILLSLLSVALFVLLALLAPTPSASAAVVMAISAAPPSWIGASVPAPQSTRVVTYPPYLQARRKVRCLLEDAGLILED